MTTVRLLDLASDQVGPLLVASEAEDFRFLRRVVSEWEAGTNLFAGKGKALLGYFVDDHLVAVCGLMRDPYQGKATVGRLRNLYVLPEHSRSSHRHTAGAPCHPQRRYTSGLASRLRRR
jgi:hypothetical protein